ncbi:MAG: hypothetical protein IKN17_10355 [Ruminococcus sp.]|nr:hypothetical protein [Ruminococcus sp.]
MDIYGYLNSKTVADYCRSIGHQFNASESAFIINDCKHISFEKKIELMQEIMDTMPDVKRERPKMYFGSDSFFHALKETYIHDDFLHAYEYLIHAEKYGLLCQYGYYFGGISDDYTEPYIYSSYERALEALKKDVAERGSDEYYGMWITARKPDSDLYITGYLNEDFEVSSVDHNSTDSEDLFDSFWVYIPTPFKKGDLVYSCSANYRPDPMVLTDIDYWDKDEAWFEKRKNRADSSDMTAYCYWLNRDGYLYDECVHDYHNLEYFTGELCTRKPHFHNSYTDYRLLKAVSEMLKGELDPHMLLIANDALRRERDFRDSFPGWDYVEDYYKKAGLEDILAKRRLWEEYDRERYDKADE